MKMTIGPKEIGSGRPCFIIAEAGINHNGEHEMARRLVDIAADAGADAVKFQTFHADREISIHAPKADYQLQSTDPSESQLAMAKRLELPLLAFGDLFKYCRKRGILFLSTPSDEECVDYLAGLPVAAFKMASGEINNFPLVTHAARKGAPMIISTGMSNLDEVRECVEAVYQAGNRSLALLHCVSNYPAVPLDVNLRAMDTLAREFGAPVGYSDHTTGIEIACAAVARGACIIEKHFTLDKSLPGPDHRASLDPLELKELILAVRRIEASLGDGVKRPRPSEENVRKAARRSIVAARLLPIGTRLKSTDLAVKRPGVGLPSRHIPEIVGRVTARTLEQDELIEWESLSNG